MSNTKLKIIAIISMVFDHVWRFFPNSPYIFHWIGRISAPIFLFSCVQGYIHTSNKKKFFIRVYLLNIIVEIINVLLKINYLRMNFIRTILLVLVIVFIIDKFKNNHKKAKSYLRIFLCWQLVTSIIIFYLLSSDSIVSFIGNDIVFLIMSITANITYLDGGIIFIAIGVCFYIFKDNKIKLSLSFIINTILYIIIFNIALIQKLDTLSINATLINAVLNSISDMFLGINPMNIRLDLLWENPQWMMIFSLPFILKYNNKKGNDLKYFFYLFYPIHIVILYTISTL